MEFKDYTVEVFHKGRPLCLIDLKEQDEANARRRAKSAVWMMALRDGREFHMEDIESFIYNG